MYAYLDNFHCKLLHMHNTMPAKVLDHFLYGLHLSVHMQVFIADPNTFVYAAFLAEHMRGAHGEATCNGPQLMDLGAVQGSSMGVA